MNLEKQSLHRKPGRARRIRSRILSAQSLALVLLILLADPSAAWAHHVLGRPAYSLNEDSNTPPAMTVETQMGDYFISATVFPAFPRPGEPGRVHFYATHLDTGEPFRGKVRFSVRDDGWLYDSREESLGVQVLDDDVYRQGFLFNEPGAYIINVFFEDGGEPYSVDFPLRIGAPSAQLPLGIAVGVILLALGVISLIQRKRVLRAKLAASRDARRSREAVE